MPTHPDIRVLPADAALRPALLTLDVDEAQHAYIGRVADSLADADACESSEPMAILCGVEPIGFYRVERSARSIAGIDFERATLGLRSFFIDARWQGRGLGTLALDAAMRDLVLRHPSALDVVLTVNIRNTAAIALYRRYGFQETGGLYHGGRSGPQHLMVCALPR